MPPCSATGRTIVPNLFTVELARATSTASSAYDEELEKELVAAAQEHAESQRYQPGGPLQVNFARPTTSRPASSGCAPPPRAAPGGASTPAPAPAPAQPAPRHTPLDEDGLEATQAQAPVAPPAPPRRVNPADRPWLDVDGERYPLMGAMTVLGRDDTADIVLDDPGISRRHSEIRVTNDGPHLVASIRDLGSTNGTFVNSERISSQRLSDGDRITVGRTTRHLPRRAAVMAPHE